MYIPAPKKSTGELLVWFEKDSRTGFHEAATAVSAISRANAVGFTKLRGVNHILADTVAVELLALAQDLRRDLRDMGASEEQSELVVPLGSKVAVKLATDLRAYAAATDADANPFYKSLDSLGESLTRTLEGMQAHQMVTAFERVLPAEAMMEAERQRLGF
jgi:hypothetical protein